MGKEQKGKEFKFDPADYDYLDKAPIEDWVSEILSRNKEFQAYVEKTHTSSPNKNIGSHKYKVWINSPRSRYKKYTKSGKLKLTLLDEKVAAYRIFGKENEEIKQRYDELYEKKSEFWASDDWTGSRLTNSEFQLNLDDNVEDMLESLFGLPDTDGYYDTGDKLILAIDMNSMKEDIIKHIEYILKIHKPKKRVRRRLKEWKYYLIVFDLREQGLSYKDISDTLCENYPRQKRLFDERNLVNYYESAVILINGGYKKYI